jgi:hypothetical protein
MSSFAIFILLIEVVVVQPFAAIAIRLDGPVVLAGFAVEQFVVVRPCARHAVVSVKHVIFPDRVDASLRALGSRPQELSTLVHVVAVAACRPVARQL